MEEKLIKKIALARIIVGYLGENHQAKWWDCSFFSSSSDIFLAPIFPKSKLLAKYNGVCEAAIKVHDEYIGIGRHFHLYRLPDSIEQNIVKTIREKDFEESIVNKISNKDAAFSELTQLSTENTKRAEGPVTVGNFSDNNLEKSLNLIIAHYKTAFKEGYKTFPNMKID